MILPVLAAVLLSIVTNSLGGVVLARVHRLNQRSAANAALVLLGRGEFSLIIATLGIAAGLDERIAPFTALYVLVLALIGPVLATRSRWISSFVPNRLVGGGFEYVGQTTMTPGCEHVEVELP